MPTLRSQKRMQDEALHALRARFEDMGLFSKWKKGARCAVFWALESVPEELWARGVLCPAERVVMLGATSRRVRALLERMQRRVPAAVRVRTDVSMESVAGGLPNLLAGCSVVRLDLSSCEIGAEGAGSLAGVLGQCSSLAELHLGYNSIGAEGAGRLAGVLGQCSSLAELDLRYNSIGDDGIAMLRACWPGGSGLEIDDQFESDDE